jgi:integrase
LLADRRSDADATSAGIFNHLWSAALRDAAKAGTPAPEGFHFHDLRHTANGFASEVASLR